MNIFFVTKQFFFNLLNHLQTMSLSAIQYFVLALDQMILFEGRDFHQPSDKVSHGSFFFASSPDGVGVGQRWSHRNDGGQVHGAAGGRATGLVPQHGGRRDVAGQHVPQEGQEVGGSNPRPLGRVSAGAPEVTGTSRHAVVIYIFFSSFQL